MKPQFKIMFAVLLMTAYTMAFAQTPPTSGTTIKNLDSVRFQLNKFGIPLTDLPMYTPCNREGIAPIVIPDNGGLKPYDPPIADLPDSGFFKKPPYEDVNIYWLHGLNGSVKSWYIAATATEFGFPGIFEARRAKCIIPNFMDDQSYLEETNIRASSFDVARAVDRHNGITRTDNDFVIAHSQGGIVAREWIRNMDEKPGQYKDYVHGLVTFGTPHTGARILNNTRPDLGNKLPEFFQEACEAVGGALVSDIMKNNFLANLIVTNNMREDIMTTACSGLIGTVIPFALDNYFRPTTNDYYVGAPFLTQPNIGGHPTSLTDYALNVPVVQFYGEEEQPIMWRFFSSTMKLGVDQLNQTGNASNVFAYDQDDQLQIKVSRMITDFTASKHHEESLWKELFNVSCFKKAKDKCGVFNLPCIALERQLCQNDLAIRLLRVQGTVEQYAKAITWLSNANEYYLYSIVGGKVDSKVKYCVTETTEYCVTSYPFTSPPLPIETSNTYSTSEALAPSTGCPYSTIMSATTELVGSKQTTCYITVNRTSLFKNTYHYVPNDGVVLAESASAKIKTVPGKSHYYVVMPRTNHDQMRNSSETANMLKQLYKGIFGPTFYVELR